MFDDDLLPTRGGLRNQVWASSAQFSLNQFVLSLMQLKTTYMLIVRELLERSLSMFWNT